MMVFEEEHSLLIDHRKRELELKKSSYQWEITDEKLPHSSHFKDISELPAEIRYSLSKSEEVQYKKRKIYSELRFKGLAGSHKKWKDINDMKKILQSKKTTLSGFPSCFNTVDEVVKFITMVIFRVSVQHAAVNDGQVGY
ncbi:hypothetical protein GOODEAATRI_027194 [Goodea atripinnis]|uniref:Lipoxygenase domain-containing protein n=1 Tax=Goodea atripinnis TaxID=208336 RepID=A0ABV0NNL8_9TELE